MDTRSLNTFSATELAHRLTRREITAEAVIRSCLDRIKQRDNVVKAWEHLNEKLAIATAQALDKGSIKGILHGLPIGVKDILDTVDYPTEYGTSVYKGYQPPWDAACVSAAKSQGGIVLGKTVTVELAFFEPSKTTNPHNSKHTPGGSSSGSAAAVADCMVPLAFGTQTGGSIIRPAAYCGVVGYKPSFHWVNRAGLKIASNSLDTVGFFGRTVTDVALFASAVCNRPALLNIETITCPKKIGICRMHEWYKAMPETIMLFDKLEQFLSQRHIHFEIFELPDFFKGCTAIHRTISAYEMAQSFAYEQTHFPNQLSTILTDFLNEGKTITAEQYDATQETMLKCRAWLKDKFKSIDALITPSVPGEAPATLENTGDAAFNRLWALMGTPAINIPIAKGPSGMPLGLQVVSDANEDVKGLAMTAWLDKSLENYFQ